MNRPHINYDNDEFELIYRKEQKDIAARQKVMEIKKRKLSWETIYKLYKHGADLQEINIEDIYNALKGSGLQVVLIYDKNNNERIYNYIPETNKFIKVV